MGGARSQPHIPVAQALPPESPTGVRARPLEPVPSRSLVASLTELAARVQRGRTVDAVIETAGIGVLELGMRFAAFQVDGDDLVLRYLATSPSRRAAIEARVGRPVVGLRAP